MAERHGGDPLEEAESDADALLRELTRTGDHNERALLGEPQEADPSWPAPTVATAPGSDDPEPGPDPQIAGRPTAGEAATQAPLESSTMNQPQEPASFEQSSIAGYQVYRQQQPPEGKRRRPRRWPWLVGILALIAATAVGGFFLGGLNARSDDTEAADSADVADSDADGASGDGTADGSADQTGTDGEASDGSPSDGAGSEGGASEGDTDGGTDGDAPATPTTFGPDSTLSFSLEDYRFTARGVVPSEEIKEAIETRMGLVFARFGTSEIEVDPSVSAAPWLEAAPSVINAMVLLHEGTIDIGPEGTVVAGRGLDRDFDGLEARLSPDQGFPPFSIASSDIIDKPAPWVRAVAPGDGTVSLTGELADETMRMTIVDGAMEIYGEENVTDATTVNPDRHNRFLIMRFPSNLNAYQVFGQFDIRGENEAFSAILEDGLVFETLETDLTPDSKERLAAVMFTLTRNPLPVNVVGHTDSVGSDADNQILSERRASSVAAFLQESGVQQDFITVEGRGEIDPIDTNATPDGRARNRRVEITVGLPDRD